MATIENEGSPARMLEQLRAMNEGELVAQQIAQNAAIHAVTFLLAKGCTESLAIEMLSQLRLNEKVIAAIAEAKGFKRMFDITPPNFH